MTGQLLTALWVIGWVVVSFGVPWILRPVQLRDGTLPWDAGDTMFYSSLVVIIGMLYLLLSTLLLLARS